MIAGSHTVLSLLEHGCKVTIIDNLDNAFQIAYERMQKLAGDDAKNMTFVKVCAGCIALLRQDYIKLPPIS